MMPKIASQNNVSSRVTTKQLTACFYGSNPILGHAKPFWDASVPVPGLISALKT